MTRILTAAVVLPVLLFAVWSKIPYYFISLTAIAVLAALREFYGLAAKARDRASSTAGTESGNGTGGGIVNVLGYASALLIVGAFAVGRPELAVPVIAVLAVLALAAQIRNNDLSIALASVSASVFGVIYVALLGGFLVGVRVAASVPAIHDAGPKLLTLFLATVMMTDTGAYYLGRAFGTHKLSPRISPGKTVEGAFGGLLFGIVTGPACKLLFFPEIGFAQAALLGAGISVAGQIGDLAESMLKRCAGVKDSSGLLPGHGGMLDRLDSILTAAPLIYYYSRYVIASHGL